MNEEIDELLTLEEAAKKLKVNPTTLWGWETLNSSYNHPFILTTCISL